MTLRFVKENQGFEYEMNMYGVIGTGGEQEQARVHRGSDHVCLWGRVALVLIGDFN